MKKVLLNAAILIAGMVCASSCHTQSGNVNEPQTIELSSEQDQFLLNFIEATPDGLSLSISREDAMYAWATPEGYADLEQQIERINSDYDKADYDYWQQNARQQRAATKASASVVGEYDDHHVLERDRFLENFFYAEDGKLVIKITEEKAVLCGATVEGYRSACDGVAELNDMILSGKIKYEDVREAYNDKRKSMLSPSERKYMISPYE